MGWSRPGYIEAVRKITATRQPSRSSNRQPLARTRVTAAAGGGFVCGACVAVTRAADAAPLLGWIAAAAIFEIWTWWSILPLDADTTAADAVREDPTRVVADLACLLAAVASLVAVGVVLVEAGNAGSTTKLLEISLAIVSVVTSWLLVHTVFTLRYARHYYAQDRGSVDFNQPAQPRYTDFAYLAFTIGMTFQVSDTDLKNSDIRGLALRHMLLSYLLGAVIVAVTINLVAGMIK